MRCNDRTGLWGQVHSLYVVGTVFHDDKPYDDEIATIPIEHTAKVLEHHGM